MSPTTLAKPAARATNLAPSVLKASPRCPACGRQPAIVFCAPHAADGRAAAPLVCLACCPPWPRAS